MSKTDRDKIIKGVTDELLKDKFMTEIGQKARVERSEITSEHMDNLREVLSEIGLNLQQVKAVPNMEYCGSLSVHVYKSSVLRTAAFATVSVTENLTFDLADAALRELTGSTLSSYGKRRQKLRSGF